MRLARYLLPLTILIAPATAAQGWKAIDGDKLFKEFASLRQLDDADVDLLRRIIGDARIGGLISIYRVFERHPDAARLVLPAILERLAIQVPESRGHYHAQLASAVTRVPSEDISRHGETIARILWDEPNWHMSGLLRRAGEIGGDPRELIKARLMSRSNGVQAAAAVAACRLGPPMAADLKPDLLGLLQRKAAAQVQRKAASQIRPDTLYDNALLALVRIGAKDEALEAYAQAFPQSIERAKKSLGDRDANFSIERCDRL